MARLQIVMYIHALILETCSLSQGLTDKSNIIFTRLEDGSDTPTSPRTAKSAKASGNPTKMQIKERKKQVKQKC